LRVATAVRYNYFVKLVAIKARSDARTEFKILERSPKGGVEAGRAHSCIGKNHFSHVVCVTDSPKRRVSNKT
jgi:hypothetical protein